jgi:hypothetical protein
MLLVYALIVKIASWATGLNFWDSIKNDVAQLTAKHHLPGEHYNHHCRVLVEPANQHTLCSGNQYLKSTPNC